MAYFSVAQAKANMHGMYGNYNGAINNTKDAAYRNAVYAFRRRHGLKPSKYFDQSCINAFWGNLLIKISRAELFITTVQPVAKFSTNALPKDGFFIVVKGLPI